MREAADPLGLSPRNPVLQALGGLLLSVPLALLAAFLWPDAERLAIAAMLLAWGGFGARAAAFAWRALPPGEARWPGRGPLLLRIATGMAALAVCGVLGAILLLLA